MGLSALHLSPPLHPHFVLSTNTHICSHPPPLLENPLVDPLHGTKAWKHSHGLEDGGLREGGVSEDTWQLGDVGEVS